MEADPSGIRPTTAGGNLACLLDLLDGLVDLETPVVQLLLVDLLQLLFVGLLQLLDLFWRKIQLFCQHRLRLDDA